MFKHKPLSIVVTALLTGGIHTLALAQNTPDTEQNDRAQLEEEEVLVIGVRGSLNRALDQKRAFAGIMDAISAEDVGKFPDANIADSLQRVTGVQISRDRGGEGRFVSIRGMSSQFNMTLMNGRTIATDNAGRDFSFDIMPSELITSAQVYKTAQASIQEGSIGGMINLETAKPLDAGDTRVAGSVGGLYDDISEKWSEQLSLIAKQTFLQDTLGVTGGLTYAKRDWRANTYGQLAGYGNIALDVDGDGVLDSEFVIEDGVERERATAIGAVPKIPSHGIQFGERERLGFVGVLQWRPNDTFETTVDAFYSHYKTPENSFSFNVNYTTANDFTSNPLNHRFENVEFEEINTGHPTERYLVTAFDLPNIPFEIGNDTKARETTTYMVGSNTIWMPRDDLELVFDIAYSEADRPINGKEYFTVAGVQGAHFHFEATPDVSAHTCTLDYGGPNERPCYEVDTADLGLHFMEAKGEDVNDKALSLRLDGEYDFAWMNTDMQLVFGLTYSSRDKDKVNWRPLAPCAYCRSFSQTLGEVGVDAEVSFPGRYPYSSFDSWPALSPALLFEAAIRHSGPEYFQQNIAARPEARTSSRIEEDIVGGYLQLNVKGRHWDANFGGRWVQTGTTAHGHTQPLFSLVHIADSVNFTPDFGEESPISEENTYDNFLPSANVSYQFAEDTMIRAAVSKTITRPTISQLGHEVNWSVNSLPLGVSRGGNPQLEPFEALSYDLSLEWYGEDGAGAALALFQKDIDNLITYTRFDAEIDIDVFQADGETPYFPEGELPEFEVYGPVNGNEAMVRGVEVSVQKIFDNGFGLVANYTWVESEQEVEVNGETLIREIDGLSESTYNIAAIYETDRISSRLAYSFREGYTECGTCGLGGAPTTRKDFGTLDFSSSVTLREGLAVYAEAQNLLQADALSYSVDERIIHYYEQYARRYELGLRFKF